MADVLTKEQRHKNMKNIHGKDTKIEVILRKALWSKGYRYRKNYKKMEVVFMYSFNEVSSFDPDLAKAMDDELARQRSHIELIASENLVSKAVMAAMGSPLTNKYAEGYPGKRYYGGCEYVDVVETLAIERAKKLFGCEYANVQPHSGAQANLAAFFAMVEPGDTVMGMSLDCGGHLSHGSPVNISGKYFHIVPYGVTAEGFIDYDEVLRIAKECKPKMIMQVQVHMQGLLTSRSLGKSVMKSVHI